MKTNVDRFFFVSKDDSCDKSRYSDLSLDDSYFDSKGSPFTPKLLLIPNKCSGSESNSPEAVDFIGSKGENLQFSHLFKQEARADVDVENIRGCTSIDLFKYNAICTSNMSGSNQFGGNLPAVDHVAELLGKKKDMIFMETTISNTRGKYKKTDNPHCTILSEGQDGETQHQDDNNNEKKKRDENKSFFKEEQNESVWMKRRNKRVANLLRFNANNTNKKKIVETELKSKHEDVIDDDGFFIKG